MKNIIEYKKKYIRFKSKLLIPFVTIANLVKVLFNGKLNMLLSTIDTVSDFKVNKEGDLYIEFKSNLVINTKGSVVMYTAEGEHIISAKFATHQPEFNVSSFIRKHNIGGTIISLTHRRRLEELEQINKAIEIAKKEVIDNPMSHSIDKVNTWIKYHNELATKYNLPDFKLPLFFTTKE